MAWKKQKPPSGIPAGGPGWGGPANGGGTRPDYSADNQPTPDAKVAGKDVAREVRERIAARRLDLVDRLLALSELGETDAIRLQATNSALDRLMGKPQASVDVTTNGEALSGYVISAPSEIEDASEWASQHKPR